MLPPPEPLLICLTRLGRIALPAAGTIAVLPMLPLWRPPTLPRPLIGFVTIAGQPVPVLSPDLLFDPDHPMAEVAFEAHLVRLRGIGSGETCLLVDRVEEMILPEADAIGAVAPGETYGDCVIAEVRIASGIAHWIAPDRLMGAAERAKLDALTREATRRAHEWAIA
jgi:purine-binding chemotaxis protein CheW